MTEISKEFIECLFSASKFVYKDNSSLKYVSISDLSGAHEICGTDGMILALYTIKEDINWVINGFADLTNVKIGKNAKIIGGHTASVSGMQGIVVNLVNGKKPEHTFIPIVQDVTYPRYQEICKFNTHGISGLCDSYYGEFVIDAQEAFEAIDSLNLKRVKTVILEPDLETSSIKCTVCKNDDREKIGALKIYLRPDKTNVEPVNQTYYNPELLHLALSEASIMCKSSISLFIKSKLGPTHIKGFSDGSSTPTKRQHIYTQYIVMPMNRG